ncbi:LacI family DNA-binding transcriptional regulator, partial [Pseudomonas aeruginosa]
MPASIRDVAQRAGVSVGTVSNVLNRPEEVSSDSVERVNRAIEELGYVRNDAARKLRAGVSSTVGFVVLDGQNPFYN